MPSRYSKESSIVTHFSSRGTKRHRSGKSADFAAPKPKYSTNEKEKSEELKTLEENGKEIKEIHVDVLNSAYDRDTRVINYILRDSSKRPLIHGTSSLECGEFVYFPDRIHVIVEVLRRDESGFIVEVKIIEILKHLCNEHNHHRHSIFRAPYCLPPKYFREVRREKSQAIIVVSVSDIKMIFYEGCASCKYRWNYEEDGVSDCPACYAGKWTEPTIFGKITVRDRTNWEETIDLEAPVMEKLVKMWGFETEYEWGCLEKAVWNEEYEFEDLMIRVKIRHNKRVECVDVAKVNWDEYNQFMENRKYRRFWHLD